MTREQIHLRDALGICGCCPEETIFLYESIVDGIRRKQDLAIDIVKEYIGVNDAVAHALLCALDNAGVIEHGTSIRGSWITPEWERRIEGPTDFEKANPGMTEEDNIT